MGRESRGSAKGRKPAVGLANLLQKAKKGGDPDFSLNEDLEHDGVILPTADPENKAAK